MGSKIIDIKLLIEVDAVMQSYYMASAQFRINRHNKKIIKISIFFIKISNFLSAIAVIPLTVNKIASSGGFSPL